jgi:hypothetical protein
MSCFAWLADLATGMGYGVAKRRLHDVAGERGRCFPRAFRTVHGVGVLELDRYDAAAVGERYLPEDLGERVGFEHREVPALLALA